MNYLTITEAKGERWPVQPVSPATSARARYNAQYLPVFQVIAQENGFAIRYHDGETVALAPERFASPKTAIQSITSRVQAAGEFLNNHENFHVKPIRCGSIIESILGIAVTAGVIFSVVYLNKQYINT